MEDVIFQNALFFTAQNDTLTALNETVRKDYQKGDFYVLSKWEIIESSEPFRVEYFLEPTFTNGQLKFIVKDNIVFEDKIKVHDLSEGQIEGLIEQMKYLQDLFISDEKYFLSAALAHNRLYQLTQTPPSIIVYPSVQRDFNGFNMVINPNFVENRMKLSRFYIIKILDYDFKAQTVLFAVKSINDFKKDNLEISVLYDLDETNTDYIKEDFDGMLFGENASNTFYNKS